MSKRNAILQPLVLAVLVAIGFGLAWGIVVGWCVTVADQFASSGELYKYLYVRIDGTPLVRTTRSGIYGDWSVETLDGEPVDLRTAELTLGGASVTRPEVPHPFLDPFVRPDRQRRMYSYLDGNRPPVFWYFVYDGRGDGRAYFAGYDSRSKRLFGYIGEEGLRREKPSRDACFPVDGRMLSYQPRVIASASYARMGSMPDLYINNQFSEPGREHFAMWRLYLVSDDRLLEIDLRERTVRVVFEQQGLVSADIVTEALPNVDLRQSKAWPPMRQYVAACTEDRVLLLDTDCRLQYTFRIPEEIDFRSMTAYLVDDDTMLYLIRSLGDGVIRYELTWGNRQGGVLEQREVSFPRGGFPVSKPAESAVIGLVIPSPLVAGGFFTLVKPLAKVATSGKSYSHTLALSLSAAWPTLLAVLFVAILLAWRTWRRQREFGAAKTWLWVGFVFLFGVPGYAGYRFHRSWPTRKPCDSCGADAPRDREACFACGTEFPEPAEKGIEVFA